MMENEKVKECDWCGNTNQDEIETASFYDSYHQDGGRVLMTVCTDARACRERHRELNQEKI
jgi:hypothetical protein